MPNKTPTPRQIAAIWIQQRLNLENHTAGLDAASLSGTANSRVSEAKAAEVKDHIDKMTKKLSESIAKIVDKYTAPPDPEKQRIASERFSKRGKKSGETQVMPQDPPAEQENQTSEQNEQNGQQPQE